ncbi:hypothetical protein Tco_0713175 [Tanacetum coccineum]
MFAVRCSEATMNSKYYFFNYGSLFIKHSTIPIWSMKSNWIDLGIGGLMVDNTHVFVEPVDWSGLRVAFDFSMAHWVDGSSVGVFSGGGKG